MKFSAIAASALVMATFVAAETTTPTTTASSYDEDLDCWSISVEHDATYCISGPICSGSGDEPAGTLCPVAGDVAIADCHSYLVSYADSDSCVLPVDSTCQVIETGAWGCVISGTSSSSGESDEDVGSETGSTNGTASSTTGEDISFSSVAAGVTAGGVSAGAVAAIAAAAAVVCAAVGTVLYKKHQKNAAAAPRETMVDIVTP
jgi:hypothetical protein